VPTNEEPQNNYLPASAIQLSLSPLKINGKDEFTPI
jgi:hypothetical protein